MQLTLKNGQSVTIEALSKAHERAAFDCGRESLNRFLKEQASQDARRHISHTSVAVMPDSPRVWGYYSTCLGSIKREDLPVSMRNVPAYPIPTLHLARLATDQDVKGQGLGRIMLYEVFKVATDIAQRAGCHGVDVWAIDDEAHSFYAARGFVQLDDDRFHQFLPIKQILSLRL